MNSLYEDVFDSKLDARIWTLPTGVFHRLDGPAIICANGTKQWWEWGKRHRLNGPAIEFHDGGVEYHRQGHLHRTDGPAIIYPFNVQYWYVHDHDITQEVEDWMLEHERSWPFNFDTQCEFLLRFGH